MVVITGNRKCTQADESKTEIKEMIMALDTDLEKVISFLIMTTGNINHQNCRNQSSLLLKKKNMM